KDAASTTPTRPLTWGHELRNEPKDRQTGQDRRSLGSFFRVEPIQHLRETNPVVICAGAGLGSDVTALGVPSGAERRRGAWTGQRAGGEEAEAEAGQGEPAAVGVEPELRAAVAAPGVEGAVGAVVAGDGGPEVVGAVRVGRLVGLLGVV